MYKASPGFAKSEKTVDCPRLRQRDGSGGDPLQAARNPELLRLCGLSAGVAVGKVRAALNKSNGDGDLPIHIALGDTATGRELVRTMLDAGGEAMLGVPGYYKRLPLHRAAFNSQSPAAVALLLVRGPAETVWAQDAPPPRSACIRCAVAQRAL